MIITVIQWIIQLLSKPLFRFFLHLEVEGQENIKDLKGPLIVAVNHTSWLDPFIAGAAMPLFWRGIPLRFATWSRYFYSILLPFIWSLGGFPIKRGIGLEDTLKTPLKLLKRGQAILIFPEGKRRHFGRPRKGRRGVAYLALQSAPVPLTPILITGITGLTISSFIRREKGVRVCIGQQFYLDKNLKYPEDLDRATDFIMSRIRDLGSQTSLEEL